MKARELKEMGTDQLQEKLAQLNLDLFNFRLAAKTGNAGSNIQHISKIETIFFIKPLLFGYY